MNTKNLKAGLLGTVIATSALVFGADAKSDTAQTGGGVQAVYGNVPADQVEFSPRPTASSASTSSGAPTDIWQTLEHGEAVQCMNCIGAVAPLLYDPLNAKNREIAAWWLRKRVFGVFGPGEVYEQTSTRSPATPARSGADSPRALSASSSTVRASHRSRRPPSTTATLAFAPRRCRRSVGSTTTARAR